MSFFGSKPPDNTIRFLTHWRGREPGLVTQELDYGVADVLVLRGIAEWCPGGLARDVRTAAPTDVRPKAKGGARG